MKKQLIIGLISMLGATYSLADTVEGGGVQTTSAIVVAGAPSPESIEILTKGEMPRQ